jgi:hypothetical protein
MTRSLPNLSLPPVGGKILVGGGILLLIALFFGLLPLLMQENAGL